MVCHRQCILFNGNIRLAEQRMMQEFLEELISFSFFSLQFLEELVSGLLSQNHRIQVSQFLRV